MAYTPYYNSSGTPNWQDGSSGGTPIRAAALNNMETGIKNLDAKLNGTIVSNSNTVTGVTIYLFYNPAAPNLMRLRIIGTTSSALSTNGANVNLWNANTWLTNAVGARSYSNQKWVIVGNYKALITIETNGLIKIGYSTTLDGNAAANIPGGTNFYVDETFFIS